MNAHNLYEETLISLGFSAEEVNQKWKNLDHNYSQKNRYYHNWSHIEAMLDSWKQYKTHLENPLEVLLAIYYHDVIYVSTRKDNEQRSAEQAVKELGASVINTKILYDLILCTKDHQASTTDQQWLIDFDLKILGSEWEIYEWYYKQIRKEYRMYPNFMYKPGRKKALLHFLEHKQIYQTETFRSLYETKARTNIQKEITLL